MKVINVDDLRAAMYHAAFEEDSDLQKWDGGCWIRYKMFENVLDSILVIDLPIQMSGKWLPLKKGGKGYSAGDFKCSVCGEPNHTWIPKPNYCQNCGARMEV